jgi:hypothetical protein
MKNISFILLLAISLPAIAQHENMGNVFPEITHVIGGSFQKFDGLNSRIANFPQYKQLPDYAAMLELGWFKMRKRVISTGGINVASSMGANHDKRSSTIRFIGGHADVGYNLLTSDRVILYPLAGLGYEMYQARFFKDNSAVDFDNAAGSSTVQNNLHSFDLRNAFFNYRFGFGIAFKHPRYPSGTIGIQAGYTGSFQSNPWKSSQDQTLGNAPEDKLSRFYVGLVLTGRPGMMGSMKH